MTALSKLIIHDQYKTSTLTFGEHLRVPIAHSMYSDSFVIKWRTKQQRLEGGLLKEIVS